MGKILGLDLGTNSIGWAIIDCDTKKPIECVAILLTMPIFRHQKQNKKQVLTRISYHNKIIESKYSSNLTILKTLATLTFILSLINNMNWQFWLNICITTLVALLTIIHQDKEK